MNILLVLATATLLTTALTQYPGPAAPGQVVQPGRAPAARTGSGRT